VIADDGNHTFLAAELMPIHGPRRFFSPSDFNAMGYCVPATIGAKQARPDVDVVGIVGDGALLMTGMELITAARCGLGIVMVVFNDGELSQIAQAQQIPYNRKTCTVLTELDYAALSQALGVEYVSIPDNEALEAGLADAFGKAADNRPVLVDLRVDYSRKTRFTQGW